MSELSLVLFDDAVAQAWEPFALTRPAGELLFGALTLRNRAERVFGARCIAHLAADHLVGFEEAGAPPVRRLADAPADGNRLFLLSRAVPAWSNRLVVQLAAAGPLRMGEEVVGWNAPAGTPAPSADFLLQPTPASAPARGAEGESIACRLMRHVWELIAANPAQISEDIEALFPGAQSTVDAGVHRLGEGSVVCGRDVRIEPGVLLDTRDGPIWLDDGARVRAFTRLAGPAYIGAGSMVLGGALEAVSIGPVCKVRGELAESVCLGYTNKQHDGHIGHAYLGRWVNLGAETTNSDLKNNYGTIRVWTPRGEVDTGEIKLGSLLGDHVKTGIGLLLDTGTVIGAGSNLFGAAMPPKFVAPFSWGSGSELTEYRVDKFLEVAERAMARREVELGEAMREVLRRAWTRGREYA